MKCGDQLLVQICGFLNRRFFDGRKIPMRRYGADVLDRAGAGQHRLSSNSCLHFLPSIRAFRETGVLPQFGPAECAERVAFTWSVGSIWKHEQVGTIATLEFLGTA